MGGSMLAWVREAMPRCDRWSMRWEEERLAGLMVHQGVLLPPTLGERRGVMLTVQDHGGVGYASTADLRRLGIRAAK